MLTQEQWHRCRGRDRDRLLRKAIAAAVRGRESLDWIADLTPTPNPVTVRTTAAAARGVNRNPHVAGQVVKLSGMTALTAQGGELFVRKGARACVADLDSRGRARALEGAVRYFGATQEGALTIDEWASVANAAVGALAPGIMLAPLCGAIVEKVPAQDRAAVVAAIINRLSHHDPQVVTVIRGIVETSQEEREAAATAARCDVLDSIDRDAALANIQAGLMAEAAEAWKAGDRALHARIVRDAGTVPRPAQVNHAATAPAVSEARSRKASARADGAAARADGRALDVGPEKVRPLAETKVRPVEEVATGVKRRTR